MNIDIDINSVNNIQNVYYNREEQKLIIKNTEYKTQLVNDILNLVESEYDTDIIFKEFHKFCIINIFHIKELYDIKSKYMNKINIYNYFYKLTSIIHEDVIDNNNKTFIQLLNFVRFLLLETKFIKEKIYSSFFFKNILSFYYKNKEFYNKKKDMCIYQERGYDNTLHNECIYDIINYFKIFMNKIYNIEKFYKQRYKSGLIKEINSFLIFFKDDYIDIYIHDYIFNCKNNNKKRKRTRDDNIELPIMKKRRQNFDIN